MRLLAYLAPGLDVLQPLRDAIVLRGGWASWKKSSWIGLQSWPDFVWNCY